MTRCPHCNRPITVHLDASSDIDGFKPIPGGWRRTEQSEMSSTVRAPLLTEYSDDDFPVKTEASYERITPIDRLKPVDILTSLMDAGVTFCLISLGIGGACWYWEAPYIIVPAISSGFLAGCLRYYGGLALAKSLLQTIESVTKRDLDQDGHIGQPPPPQQHTVRVELKETNDQGSHYQFANLGLEPDKLYALAVAVLRGDSFSERTATRYNLTQDEFRSLRDEFIERGWAQWNHPSRKQQGVSLTRGGQFILRAIRDTPLPSPTAGYATANAPHARTQQHAARNSSRAGSDYEFIEGAE